MKNPRLGMHLVRGTAAVALTLVVSATPALAAAPAARFGSEAAVVTCTQGAPWYSLGGLFGRAACAQGAGAPAAAAGSLSAMLPQSLLNLFGLGSARPAAPTTPAADQPFCGPPLVRAPVTPPQTGTPPQNGNPRAPITIILPPTYIPPRPRPVWPAPTRPVQPTPTPPTQPAPTPPTQPAPTPPTQPAPTPPTQPAPTPPTQPAPTPPTQPAPTPPVQPGPAAGLSAAEQQMLSLVNGARQQAGLAPLQVDPLLMQVGRVKAQDMVTNHYFDHNSPTLGSPFDLMHRYGVSYSTAGENIAGNGSVAGAFQSLMNSPGHRANILNPSFTRIGLGIVSGGPYGMMIAQEFAG